MTCKGMPGFGVGSMNCNGLGDSLKLNKVLNWLNLKNDDIIFLQETHSEKVREADWENIWGPNIYFSHGTSNSTGVAILIKRNSNIKVINHIEICCGRAQLLEIEHDTVKFALVNVYCPNNDDLDFLKKVFHETLGRARDDMIIYGGDWNAVMDESRDRSGVL